MEKDEHRVLLQNLNDLDSELRIILSLPQQTTTTTALIKEEKEEEDNAGAIHRRIIFLKNLIAAATRDPGSERKQQLSDLSIWLEQVESAFIAKIEAQQAVVDVSRIVDQEYEQHCTCDHQYGDDVDDHVCSSQEDELEESRELRSVKESWIDGGFKVYENPEFQYELSESIEVDQKVADEAGVEEDESALINDDDDEQVIQEEEANGRGGANKEDVTTSGEGVVSLLINDDEEVTQAAASCGKSTQQVTVTAQDGGGGGSTVTYGDEEVPKPAATCDGRTEKLTLAATCDGRTEKLTVTTGTVNDSGQVRKCNVRCDSDKGSEYLKRNNGYNVKVDDEYCRWQGVVSRLLLVLLMVVGLVVVGLDEWRRFDQVVGVPNLRPT